MPVFANGRGAPVVPAEPVETKNPIANVLNGAVELAKGGVGAGLAGVSFAVGTGLRVPGAIADVSLDVGRGEYKGISHYVSNEWNRGNDRTDLFVERLKHSGGHIGQGIQYTVKPIDDAISCVGSGVSRGYHAIANQGGGITTTGDTPDLLQQTNMPREPQVYHGRMPAEFGSSEVVSRTSAANEAERLKHAADKELMRREVDAWINPSSQQYGVPEEPPVVRGWQPESVPVGKSIAPIPGFSSEKLIEQVFKDTDIVRSHTEAAKGMQYLLNEYAGADLQLDGVIGPKTTEAIKAFQKAQGLKVDGLVGEKTKAALLRVQEEDSYLK